MQCPSCNNVETKVLDSREIDSGLAVRRRRACIKCGHRFSTLEKIEILRLVVVKKDGRREQYLREKMENGIRKALEKRPISEARVRETIASIEKCLQAEDSEEISSRMIGATIMRYLRDLDDVAYIRFASVYKSFKDAETFGVELRRMRKKKDQKTRNYGRKNQ